MCSKWILLWQRGQDWDDKDGLCRPTTYYTIRVLTSLILSFVITILHHKPWGAREGVGKIINIACTLHANRWWLSAQFSRRFWLVHGDTPPSAENPGHLPNYNSKVYFVFFFEITKERLSHHLGNRNHCRYIQFKSSIKFTAFHLVHLP